MILERIHSRDIAKMVLQYEGDAPEIHTDPSGSVCVIVQSCGRLYYPIHNTTTETTPRRFYPLGRYSLVSETGVNSRVILHGPRQDHPRLHVAVTTMECDQQPIIQMIPTAGGAIMVTRGWRGVYALPQDVNLCNLYRYACDGSRVAMPTNVYVAHRRGHGNTPSSLIALTFDNGDTLVVDISNRPRYTIVSNVSRVVVGYDSFAIIDRSGVISTVAPLECGGYTHDTTPLGMSPPGRSPVLFATGCGWLAWYGSRDVRTWGDMSDTHHARLRHKYSSGVVIEEIHGGPHMLVMVMSDGDIVICGTPTQGELIHLVYMRSGGRRVRRVHTAGLYYALEYYSGGVLVFGDGPCKYVPQGWGRRIIRGTRGGFIATSPTNAVFTHTVTADHHFAVRDEFGGVHSGGSIPNLLMGWDTCASAIYGTLAGVVIHQRGPPAEYTYVKYPVN